MKKIAVLFFVTALFATSSVGYANIGGGGGPGDCGYVQEEQNCPGDPANSVALICKRVTEGGENKCYATTCESPTTVRITCDGSGI